MKVTLIRLLRSSIKAKNFHWSGPAEGTRTGDGYRQLSKKVLLRGETDIVRKVESSKVFLLF